jgi:hypothetical protein
MANIIGKKDNFTVTCSPFAGGDIGQSLVAGQGAGGLEQFSHTFGKFPSDKEGDKKSSEEEKLMRERAKKANKIYKQVCEDLQMGACFFSNFGEWSQYVEGKMSDAEFHGHVVTRAQEMMVEQN